MLEVLWAVGTSPRSLGILGMIAGIWVLVAAIIPQIPPPEVVQRIGGGGWQVVRLFMAHDVAHSWVTWMLITALALNCAGIAFRYASGRARILLAMAILCAIFGFSIESIATHTGEIKLTEGLDLQENGFRANQHSFAGATPVQLPFVMQCAAENAEWLVCDFRIPGSPAQREMVPSRGNGSVNIAGMTLSYASDLPSRGGSWVRVNRDDFGLNLKASEVVKTPASDDSDDGTEKLGAILTPGGAILARKRNSEGGAMGLEIGIPSNWSPATTAPTRSEISSKPWTAQSPRLLTIRYHRSKIPGLSVVFLAVAMLCFLLLLREIQPVLSSERVPLKHEEEAA